MPVTIDPDGTPTYPDGEPQWNGPKDGSWVRLKDAVARSCNSACAGNRKECANHNMLKSQQALDRFAWALQMKPWYVRTEFEVGDAPARMAGWHDGDDLRREEWSE